MLSVTHSVSDYTTILSVTHPLTQHSTVLSVTQSAGAVRCRILLLRPLLCHWYCPRAARIGNEGSDLQRNKDQYNVRTCARSEDDEHATRGVSTSFRTSSMAIGVSVQGVLTLTCTNEQIKQAKHVGGSRDCRGMYQRGIVEGLSRVEGSPRSRT